MDSDKINSFLHSGQVPQHYVVKTGEVLEIILPKIPLTRHTEFLLLEGEKFGDIDSFLEMTPTPQQGEGTILLNKIKGRAIHPGKVHFVWRAKDSLSGEEIPDVQPLHIVVEVNP